MITHFLGDQEVAAYCRDLANRLVSNSASFPQVWAVLGLSGEKIGDALLEAVRSIRPDLASQVSLLVARYDRVNDAIEYSGGSDDIEWPATPVLLLDSAIHSGRSMLRLYRSLRDLGATDFISFGLVLKSGSVMVPTYFGMVIEDKDRAYFQLDDLPNNRLGHPPPVGLLREITDQDVDRLIEEVGPPFVGLTVGDMIYDIATKRSKVYIFEKDDKISGFINFRLNGATLFIDAWGTGTNYQGFKIGSATMRWAETWARSKKCEQIELWAFSTAIPIYEAHGYKAVEGEDRNLGGGQTYRVMRKKILYNVRPTSEDEIKSFY